MEACGKFVDLMDYKVLNALDVTLYGEVFRVKNKKEKMIQAMKVIRLNQYGNNESYCKLINDINHPFFLSLHQSF